jgi:hypothetical protein
MSGKKITKVSEEQAQEQDLTGSKQITAKSDVGELASLISIYDFCKSMTSSNLTLSKELIRQLSKVQSSLEKVIAEKVVSSFLE